MYTDPSDRWAHALTPAQQRQEMAPRGPISRCPTCHYLVLLPCQACALNVPVRRIETRDFAGVYYTQPLSEKGQAILALAKAWVAAHRSRPLTAGVIDHDEFFPFQKSYVYLHFGTIATLERMAREAVFSDSRSGAQQKYTPITGGAA